MTSSSFRTRQRMLTSSFVNGFNTRVDQFLMVGNSFRSDIEPVLKLGGWAAHIPSDSIWKHEVVEEYDHPNLIRLNNFAQLQSHLSATGTILNDYKPS